MNPTTIRIARRIATYMLEVAEQQIDLSAFMGLGLTLAICYEEMTGQPAANKRPQELIQWALNLPQEKYPIIRG